MRVFVSAIHFPDRIPFSDTDDSPVDITQPIQLIFVDGSATVEVFKQLYLAGVDAYFVVKNMEYFMSRMRLFRNLNFVMDDRTVSVERSPGGVLGVFGVSSWECMSPRLGSMVKKYISVEQRLRGGGRMGRHPSSSGVEESIKGLQMSFRPDILESIKSSLENCKLYKSKETRAHKIFKVLGAGKLRLSEIEKAVGGEIEKTLKSLVYFGIVVRRGEFFALCDIVL